MKQLALGFALLCSASCVGTCGGGDELAELQSLSGSEVERDVAAAEGAWQVARVGERFRLGDGLRTGARSAAMLALFPSGAAQVAPLTVLRFRANAPSDTGAQVSVESGEVEILAQQMDLEVHTPRAVARVSRGSKLRLSMVDGRERFDLLVGHVLVAHEGVNSTLAPDHGLWLGRAGGDEPDAEAPPGSTDVIGSEAGAAVPPEVADAGQAILASTTLRVARAELNLQAVESATLHAAQLPIDVWIPAPACPERSQIIVDGQTVAGEQRGSAVRLGKGAHIIRALCGSADALSREARVRVRRDAAGIELPKRAQNVRVEADGRNYTVRYQNLLPVVTFVWPGRHEGNRFTLVVQKGSHEITQVMDRAEHAVPGALLGDGEHKFWFHDGSGRPSKGSTLRLSFDNTARSAYLSAPREGSVAHGPSIRIEGAALLRSRVFVEGQPVTLDESGHFRADAPLTPAQKTVSVRIEHPASGIHYYLRRLR